MRRMDGWMRWTGVRMHGLGWVGPGWTGKREGGGWVAGSMSTGWERVRMKSRKGRVFRTVVWSQRVVQCNLLTVTLVLSQVMSCLV